MDRKYEEVDKQMTKIIMKEFEGQTIEHVCPECGGTGIYRNGEDCQNCNKTGAITIQH